MITYSFGVPTQRRCGDLSLADVGIVGEGSSHGIRRSGGSETIFWVMQRKSYWPNKLAFFLCNSVPRVNVTLIFSKINISHGKR